MRFLVRLLAVLLLTVLIVVAGAWAVVAFTDLPGRVATSGFNESHPELWLEARGARLHGDLLGLRVDGLSLAERAGKDALVRLDRFDAALGALPSADVVSVDHVDVEGLHVRLTDATLPVLQRALAGAPSVTPPEVRPGALVRLGRLRVTGASFAWRAPGQVLEVPGLDLTASGVLGTKADLDITAALAGLTTGSADASLALGRLALRAAIKADPATRTTEATFTEGSLESLAVAGWQVEGLSLARLAVAGQGLTGSLDLQGLGARRVAGPAFELSDVLVALKGTGGVAGAEISAFTLTSPRLSLRAKGLARPSLGFTAPGLAVSAEGGFEAQPAALLPQACAGVSRASGTFKLEGDALKGGLTLQGLEITAVTAAGERRLGRVSAALTGASDVAALVTELCAEAGRSEP